MHRRGWQGYLRESRYVTHTADANANGLGGVGVLTSGAHAQPERRAIYGPGDCRNGDERMTINGLLTMLTMSPSPHMTVVNPAIRGELDDLPNAKCRKYRVTPIARMLMATPDTT